ncbi:hypothetical protein GCM10027443_37250 [Pontibacter brevis]
MEENSKGNEVIDQKNMLEWAVFWASLLLLISIFSYLGYHVYADKPSTPDLYVELWPDPSAQQPTRYRVQVHNKGGETAESVMVEIYLQEDGEQLEKVELQMMFVPKESRREGWVIFNRKPKNESSVKGQVVSYQKP